VAAADPDHRRGIRPAPPPAAAVACIALAAAFFVLVFVQQAYLRYLLPALLVAAAAGGWALQDLPDRRAVRMAVTLAGALLIAVNLRLMYTQLVNAQVCRRCAFDEQARRQYVAQYAAAHRQRVAQRQRAEWTGGLLPARSQSRRLCRLFARVELARHRRVQAAYGGADADDILAVAPGSA
jgi:hypothetical protein